MTKLTGAALDRAVANAMGLNSVHNCEKWGEHMILDEGCAERGCPMHDSRETKGVVFIRKEWVGLTETQIQNIYYEVVADHRGAPMPWGQVVFAQAVQAALKELNT